MRWCAKAAQQNSHRMSGRGISRNIFLLCISLSLNASEIPNFADLSQTENAILFLSTPRSGSNWISGCLSAITRKPISWLHWKRTFFQSIRRHDPSYNRLKLHLVTGKPLLYRTHYEFDELMQIPSDRNKLIFVTRNPKELIFRAFFLSSPGMDFPSTQFLDEFLIDYLPPFEIYDKWADENRFLVFYEDFIENDDSILLDLIVFMKEEPCYWEDFSSNKQSYFSRLIKSYQRQHKENLGGASSSKSGPQAIYYTQYVSADVLKEIDEYIQKKSPLIWEKYLKRFAD